MTFAGLVRWPRPKASLYLPFAISQSVAGRGLSSGLTFTRASAQTGFNSAGVMTSYATDVPVFDYNPTTLAPLGLSLWEARTNSIRNNTMVGAAAGTPGTMPTNWFTFTALTGITRTVVGSGTENGVAYIDVRLNGTPSAAGTYLFGFESNNQMAALTGQTWTASIYHKLLSGTLTGVNIIIFQESEYTAANAFITFTNGSALTSPSAAALSTQRVSTTFTTNGGATTAFIQVTYILFLTGAAIDMTLRIGLPQLELGAFATPVIQTSGAAATRAAPSCSTTSLAWYNATEGTVAVRATPGGTVVTNGFIAALSDGTANNEMGIFTGSSVFVDLVTTGGVGQANIFGGSPAVGTAGSVAAAYKVNDFSAAANGTLLTPDSAGTVPTVNKLNLGSRGDGTFPFSGWIASLAYYPSRLANGVLQGLST